MRLSDILTEKVVGTLHLSGFDIIVNDHSFDQAKARGVPHTVIDPILKKLDSVRTVIDRIEPGQQLWVYASAYNVSIGFRKYDNHGGTIRLALNTVLARHPGDKADEMPVIELPY